MKLALSRWSLIAIFLVTNACTGSSPTADVSDIDAVITHPDAIDHADSVSPIDVVIPPAPEVTLPEGTLRGVRGAGYQAFFGIPYAAPPVGPLRWKPPVSPGNWAGTRDATASPPACAQLLGTTVTGQEDCLVVNVVTPDPIPRNAPVMVWLHGGAFIVGEGVATGADTRGDNFAVEHGVVVVTLNYRLGALGFLAHPALTAEGGGHSGNYGLLDQVFAMQWVRDHISAFGGDPTNVTLFGESAGGISVCSHIVSPLSTGLFHRAIVESGPCGLPVPALAVAEAQGQRFATALHCSDPSDATCLRSASVDAVLTALPLPPAYFSPDLSYAQWFPDVDGTFFPDQPMNLIRAGTIQRIPLIFGWNHNEGTLFAFLGNQAGLTATDYPAVVRALLNGDDVRTAQVLAEYPLANYPTPWQAYAAVLGDYVLACPARRTLRAMTPFMPHVYQYHFAYPEAQFVLPTGIPLGAFHSAEIQFVFGHPARPGHPRFTGNELALHQAMLDDWSRFAITGDPNGTGAFAWPEYAIDTENNVTFDATVSSGSHASAPECDFWETLGLYP